MLVSDPSPGLKTGGTGHLCVLTTGRDALAFGPLTPAARHAAITAELVRLFGRRAAAPRQWSEKLWAEDTWTRGGYASNPTPGTLVLAGRALTEPVDGIHWAGSEAIGEWVGYMEGALASGERAAREVLGATLV